MPLNGNTHCKDGHSISMLNIVAGLAAVNGSTDELLGIVVFVIRPCNGFSRSIRSWLADGLSETGRSYNVPLQPENLPCGEPN
jgi:hypothetical protein